MSYRRFGLTAVLGLLAAGACLSPARGMGDGSVPDAGAAAAPDTLGGSVSGRVISLVGDRPVADALVRLERTDGDAELTAVSDDRGRFRFDSVPAGVWRLEVTSLDHDPFRARVRVPEGGDVVLDAVLDPAPLELPGLTARPAPAPLLPGRAQEPDGAVRGRPGDPRMRALGTGPGPAGIARAFGGVRPRPPSEPGSVLFVRGGASDLKQVFLDGAPVYAPFHLGGLMEAVAPGVMSSGRLYTGGAPLAYDGGLSYVLDLRTRPGDDDVTTGGHVDLLGAGLRTGGSTGDLSYMVSGRTTHDASSERLLEGRLPYAYEEALGRADLALSDDHRLSLTGFVNREAVEIAEDVPTRRASWGNRAASLRYGARLGATRGQLTAAASRFDTRLPVSASADGDDRSETDRIRVALDLSTDLQGTELTYGAALNRHRTALETAARTNSSPGLRWHGTAVTLAGYGAATFHPWDDVDLRAGLRGTFRDGGSLPQLAPRVALTWRASETSLLEISTGRFHQVLEAPQSTLAADLDAWTELLRRSSSEPGVGADGPGLEFPSDLSSRSASHVTVRLEHAPRSDLDLGLEGYFKTLDGLAGPHDLHASGADLWATYRSEEWKAWGGYSLAWTWSDRPAERGVRSFSGRQLASAGGRAPLPSGLRLSARVQASSGLPFAAIPLPDEPKLQTATPTGADDGPAREPALAGSPDGSYLRLDLTLSRRVGGDLLGAEATLRPYLRLVNALDRRDALFFQVDPGASGPPRGLDTFPVLPVLGLEMETP